MADEQESKPNERQRVLRVKIDIDWKDPASKALYQAVRDLSWAAAKYRNDFIRRRWAEICGFRVDPAAGDKADITKQARALNTTLSGAVYSACEREVQGAWQRLGGRILAGSPLPEWKPTAALSIRGHKLKKDSGIRLEIENGQFVAHVSVRSKKHPDGCWMRLPIAKHTRRDEFQGELLTSMVSWETPIAKAALQVKPHALFLWLTYKKDFLLPPMGNRVATLGPLMDDGRLRLRTETQTKDFSSVIEDIHRKKDNWEGIRRRALAQIGWRKGHARQKRKLLARHSWEDWLTTRLHTWSREMIDWLATQGVGTLHVESIENGDWPAARLMQLLTYKGADVGITVAAGADIATASGERAAKAEISKVSKRAVRRARAERELTHQLQPTGT